MGKVCCVLNCPERGSSKNVTYHKVPTESKAALRVLWLKTIRRRDYLYNSVKHIYVCSKHFKQSDYLPGRANGRRHLKDGVVPSQFEWDFNSINPTISKINFSGRPRKDYIIKHRSVSNLNCSVITEPLTNSNGIMAKPCTATIATQTIPLQEVSTEKFKSIGIQTESCRKCHNETETDSEDVNFPSKFAIFNISPSFYSKSLVDCLRHKMYQKLNKATL